MPGSEDRIESALVESFIETVRFDAITAIGDSMHTSHTFRRAIQAMLEGVDPEVVDASHNAALEIIKSREP